MIPRDMNHVITDPHSMSLPVIICYKAQVTAHPPVPGSRNIKALLLSFVNECFFICCRDNIRHNVLKCARLWDFRHQLTWVAALKTREDGNIGAVIDQMDTKRLFMSGCINKYSHTEWLIAANERPEPGVIWPMRSLADARRDNASVTHKQCTQ